MSTSSSSEEESASKMTYEEIAVYLDTKARLGCITFYKYKQTRPDRSIVAKEKKEIINNFRKKLNLVDVAVLHMRHD